MHFDLHLFNVTLHGRSVPLTEYSACVILTTDLFVHTHGKQAPKVSAVQICRGEDRNKNYFEYNHKCI